MYRDWQRFNEKHLPQQGGMSAMLRTLRATIDKSGRVKLEEPVTLPSQYPALVVVLDDLPLDVAETALLSEASLAEDWNRPEEDEAWAHLQPAKSS